MQTLAELHLLPVITPRLQATLERDNCSDCQASCQSACKTSCTVGNQKCEQQGAGQ